MADEITTTQPVAKPGYKTSEFWLTTIAILVGTLIASGAFADTTALGRALAFIASALTAAGYSYSRGLVKKA
jgi:hypothetical protein